MLLQDYLRLTIDQPRMNLRQIEVFHAIMSAGSVTGAARMLNISQPAVSAVLRHAEYQLKMKLFQRTPTGLQPTPEANALLPHVSDVFARIEALRSFTQALRDGHSGQIVLATTSTLLGAFLPQALAQLKEENPQIRVFIHSLPKALTVDYVSQRYADLGLVYGSTNDPGIETEALASTDFVCALPKAHDLCSRAHITPEDLKSQSLISHGRYTTIGALIDLTCKRIGVELPPASIETSSSFSACLMVNAGAGVALVDPSIKTTSEFSNIVFKPFRPVIKLKTHLIFPRNKPRSVVTQNFVRHLKKRAREK